MFKWEKKLVENIDKWLMPLAFFVVTVVAFLMRRQGIWHVSFDYQNQFYTDAPGYLHTPFYTWIVLLLSYVPQIPIHTMKWLICGFDFVVAVLGVLLLKQFLREKMSNTVALVCYSLLLISPLVIEYGVVWIHPDAICFSAVLGASFCVKRKYYHAMGVLLGFACALQMQYIIFVVAACVWVWRKEKRESLWFLTSCLTILLLTMVGALMTDTSLQNGIYAMVNWLLVNPGTGEIFAGLTDWMKTMLLYYGYLIGMGMIAWAFCSTRRRIPAAVVHVVLIIFVAQILQYGY